MAKKIQTMEEVFNAALTKLDTDLHTMRSEALRTWGVKIRENTFIKFRDIAQLAEHD